MAAAGSRDRIKDDAGRKAVNALLKWKKNKLRSQSDHDEVEEDGDDFMYLSITLKKVPPQELTCIPHLIPLRHPLLSGDYSALNLCLIVDGKRITSEAAHKMLDSLGFHFVKRVLKLSKLKSGYSSFDSKTKLHDSFDAFLAAKGVAPLLPKVLGKVFYRKKRKIPVPVDLRADGSNWKEEIERSYRSSLLCLSAGTCSAVRVGRWGVNEAEEIVDNVFEAIDRVLEIVPKKWGGIKCFHLKFSDSLALPIYEHQQVLQRPDDHELGKVGDGGSGIVGMKKRQRQQESVRKK